MLKKIDFTSFKTILIAALIVRVIAAIFSQGYGMHDDHFLIIEASSSWVDGFDYNNWLPWNKPEGANPEGHSFTYVGINFLFFYLFKGIGIVDPKILMLINRLFHGLFSLLVVYFGFKITEKLKDKKNAIIVGWMLALLWVVPFLSVRNLVEVACAPFLIWGVWLCIKSNRLSTFLFAGLLMGLAASFRYQVGVFAVGIAAYYFFKWQFKPFFIFSLGVLIVFGITQGIVDYLIWGYPFAELYSYTVYNMNEGTGYLPNKNSLMYVELLMGMMLFPLGLVFGIGFFKSAKKYLLLFLPTILFIIFHSFYPSKQERFILPVLPFFIILGVIGYIPLLEKKFWGKAWNVSIKAFWVLNIPLLLFACFTYSKKSRVEAMYYFYENEIQPTSILAEGSGDDNTSLLPQFYSGKWDYPIVYQTTPFQEIDIQANAHYEYILFFGEVKLAERIQSFKTIYPKMTLEKICDPSFVDKILRAINTHNTNEYIEVWKTNIKSPTQLPTS